MARSRSRNLVLPIAAAAVVVVAVVVLVATGGSSSAEDVADTSSAAVSSDASSSETSSADAADSSSEESSSQDASIVTAAESLAAQDEAASFGAGQDVVIDTTALSQAATYYDYDADGVTVQLLAVVNEDGEVRVALNTCQVCAGSTKAYFVQEDDEFTCQNCGNSFDLDEIGEEAAYGCNPIPVTSADYELDGDDVVVAASWLEEYADAFERWKA